MEAVATGMHRDQTRGYIDSDRPNRSNPLGYLTSRQIGDR